MRNKTVRYEGDTVLYCIIIEHIKCCLLHVGFMFSGPTDIRSGQGKYVSMY